MATLSNDGRNAWQRAPQKSNKFMLAKQQHHACSTLFVHFLLSDAFGCCDPEILLPWQCDIMTSQLY